jgi:glyoxylase-like metal-dependent hydrolase (beta-lactamase superfamily II)
MMSNPRLLRRACVGAVVTAVLGAVATLGAQVAPMVRAMTEPWPEQLVVDGIEILPVRGSVYMLVGGGANVSVAIGDEGVVMVDSGSAGNASKLQNAVRRLTRKPLRYLITTAPDPDKVGGNADMVKWAGGTSGPQAAAGGQGFGQNGRSPNVGTGVIAHEAAYNRMISGGNGLTALTGDGLPDSTFFTPRKDIWANDEAVQLFFAPNAHTDGDLMVFFRGSEVVHAGEVYRTDQFPLVDLARGGSINGVLGGLNHLLEIAVPQRNQMGGTRIVPAYGRISNEADVLEYRDMLTIIRNRVQALIEKKATLAQVKAAGVALEYQHYGRNARWNTDMFVEAVYNSLIKR